MIVALRPGCADRESLVPRSGTDGSSPPFQRRESSNICDPSPRRGRLRDGFIQSIKRAILFNAVFLEHARKFIIEGLSRMVSLLILDIADRGLEL